MKRQSNAFISFFQNNLNKLIKKTACQNVIQIKTNLAKNLS
jgi:hypothetical protein